MPRLFNNRMLSFTRILITLFLLVNIGCQKEMSRDTLGSDKTPGNGGGTITGEFYYKLNLGGTNYSQDVTSTNNFIADAGVSGNPDATFSGGISYNGGIVPATGTEFGIDKGVLHNYNTMTQVQFKDFFKPGNYPYASINLTNGTLLDGISLTWISPGGDDMWITGDGNTMQQGSTFKILSTSDGTDANGAYLKVKVQFSCKLYSMNSASSGTGQLVSKAATGEAVVKFVMKN